MISSPSIAGPAERRSGRRIVAVLRFADGITFLIDKEGAREPDWPGWRLADDLGTEYLPANGGASSRDEHCTFRTPAPPGAGWIELTHGLDPEISFRVSL